MTTRVLKSATDDLYEAASEACHLAMGQLWDVLDHLGFKVGKKRLGESTLGVYPIKFGQCWLSHNSAIPLMDLLEFCR